ncbi:LAMI_0H00936g1_1 [Lachancea mirantina]|uniref:LAMI_0H00936g1_1 n=1 Tax=Lachancea mirantina TaxID=1230905 RepID=A0A1G4KDN5_9SACH|nr:LAMI_0H00936g1_1 [Lachancea mirantina]
MSKYVEKQHTSNNAQDAFSSCENTVAQRTSILDPHLSVLQLLEQESDDVAHSQDQDRQAPSQILTVDKPQKALQISPEMLHRSISDSWQSIRHTDYSILNVFGENQATQHAGILSSSDTSEDEPELQYSPSPNHFVFPGSALHSSERSSLAYSNKPRDPGIGADADNDNETVTVSLANSSNSFVMPKLSLVQKSQKFCIVVVGRPARKFYNGFPRSYQKMFEVGDYEHLENANLRNYSAVMIVFQDVQTAPALLENVTHFNRNVIPVCQRGQQHQIASILKAHARKNRIRQIHALIVMSDHREVHDLLKHLHSLSREADSGYETEVGSTAVSKRKKSYRKRSTPHLSPWIFWSISLTVGVGIGYCMSCIFSSSRSSGEGSLVSVDEFTCTDDHHFSRSPDGALEKYWRKLVYMMKAALRNVSMSLKEAINAQLPVVTWMHRISKEWLPDDLDGTVPGVASLDLVLI